MVLNFHCTLESKLKTMLISESYPREFDLVGLSGLGNWHSKKTFVCKTNLKGQWLRFRVQDWKAEIDNLLPYLSVILLIFKMGYCDILNAL